ncbi:hypothetical protein [Pedobacter cryoconitis]|uniref:Uncharacterized protein n=1 Tax=Pedobacter cryoconitis TaxID=188932 RepID=A0A327SJ83_9SPHI|nr:hypothetical protein [Pedobacter cryoconitis]RAJ28891.1 hypothetical protein LY11_03165 [Pedobacter cryoconitis]
MEITYDEVEKLKLTDAQLKSAKAVFKAMKNASKLGVHFWDNYGTLTAYNSKKVSVPIMVDRENDEYKMRESEKHFRASEGTGSEVLYYEVVKNFHAGNADDQFYAEII